MADVFSRENDAFNGSFAADGASITFPQFGNGQLAGAGVLGGAIGGPAGAFLQGAAAAGGAGLLVQTLGLQYSQMITKIYELGTKNCSYIGGRSQGGANLNRVIGPRPIQLQFYRKFGDVCDAATNNVDVGVQAGCPTADNPGNFAPSVFSMKFCVINNIGLTVAAQDVVINESLQMLFGALTLQ